MKFEVAAEDDFARLATGATSNLEPRTSNHFKCTRPYSESQLLSAGRSRIFLSRSRLRPFKPVYAAALVSLLGATMFVIYYLLFIQVPVPANILGVVWSALAGFFISIAAVFFFKAIHQGPIGLVSALSSTYPAVTLVLAISIFSATLSVQQSVGFAMVIVGVVAAAGFHASDSNKTKSAATGTLMALLAALTWGIGYGLLAEGVKLLGWQAASLVQFSVLAVCCFLLILFTRNRYETSFSTMKSSIKNPFILGSAITQQAAPFC